jgi:hypothetical protein
VHIHCCRNVFIKLLPSYGRLLWLHYSSFQASCFRLMRKVWISSYCLHIALHNIANIPTCLCLEMTWLALYHFTFYGRAHCPWWWQEQLQIWNHFACHKFSKPRRDLVDTLYLGINRASLIK